MKTLEDQLNAKADAEFNAAVIEAVQQFRKLPESIGGHPHSDTFGPHAKLLKDDGTKGNTLHDECCRLRQALLDTFRDQYRENFRAKFVAKVEAMQREMEQYIGELQTSQEEG